MKNLIYTLMAFLLVLFACDEHEPVIDYNYRVGSIYCSDGRVVPMAAYDPDTDDGVGVVVVVADTAADYRLIVMSPYDLGDAYLVARNVELDGVGTGLEDYDGKVNTAALLMAAEDDSLAYSPAADLATMHDAAGITGWYLPSVAEMTAATHGEVSRAVKLLGGDPFRNEWYITSTLNGDTENTQLLYSYRVMMPEGKIVSGFRDEVQKVRPFLLVK